MSFADPRTPHIVTEAMRCTMPEPGTATTSQIISQRRKLYTLAPNRPGLTKGLNVFIDTLQQNPPSVLLTLPTRHAADRFHCSVLLLVEVAGISVSLCSLAELR